MKNIIGISGMNSSGKSSMAEYLSKKLDISLYSTKDSDIKDILNVQEKSAIVEDISTLEQIELLKQQSNFVLLAIESEPAVRFSRWYARKGFLQELTLEDFIEKEESENSSESQLRQCIDAADYTIVHNISLDDLYTKIDDLITRVDMRKLK